MRRALRPAAPALLSVLLAVFFSGPAASPCLAQAFDPGFADFAVRVRGDKIPYRVFAVFVSPGERVPFEILTRRSEEGFVVETSAGRLERRADEGRWRWTAPGTPGRASLRISRETSPEETEILLHLLVTTPLSEARDGRLEGYRIGTYPATALRGLAIYRPPPGLFRVTPDLVDLPVSPHFRLGQFLCKQEGEFPKFLILRERLLLKLEYLLQRVNERGIRADSFFVMSGYRTPHYNHAIGNVRYSRHQWGGAADIFVDVSPVDGVMDDLDGNGRLDDRDAHFLYDLVARQVGKPEYVPLVGGLGSYGANHVRGPFVHVDARGFVARWGR